MNDIKNMKLIKNINSSSIRYAFLFDEDTQSIYVQNNYCILLGKEDIKTLIKGLQNSLDGFPENEVSKWNNSVTNSFNNQDNEDVKNKSVKSKKKGYIYFVQDGLGLIKIGLTKNKGKYSKAIMNSLEGVESEYI